jgi:hypothetical protein
MMPTACWGLACHPDGVTTWVTDGAVGRGQHTIEHRVEMTCYGILDIEVDRPTTYSNVLATNALFMSDIEGKVQVNVETDSGSASEIRTCDWGMRLGIAHLEEDQVFGNAQVVEREGLFISPSANGADCRLAGSDWLPPTLSRVSRARPTPGAYYTGLDVRVYDPAASGGEPTDSPQRYFSLALTQPRLFEFREIVVNRQYSSTSFRGNSCEFTSTDRDTRIGTRVYGLSSAVHVTSTSIGPDGEEVIPLRWTAGGDSE